jgi:hypothetical protein
MSQSLSIQEFAIAIAVKQQNPTILTPDFLRYSGIVPNNWELARQPIVTNSVAQVAFTNGVSIAAQVNKIVFSELIATKEVNEVEIAAIANKYIEKLPEVEYRAVGINFRGHVMFEQQNGSARNYIFKTLLNPGPWQEFGKAPVSAAMRFVYTLEKAQLNLDINEAGLQLPDKTIIPSVIFSANFNHETAEDTSNQRIAHLLQVIKNWSINQEIFQELIDTKFLKSENYQIKQAPNHLPMISPAETL